MEEAFEPVEAVETQAKAAPNPFTPKFEEFFKIDKYRRDIERIVESYPEKRSLAVDFKDLELYDPSMADELLDNPDSLVKAAEAALENIDLPALEVDEFRPHVRFHNLPNDSQPILRDISSKHLNKLISVEGVIRQITQVMPKLEEAKWECRRCGSVYRVDQKGHTETQPIICTCKHRDFTLVQKESHFIDSQKISIQEPLELLKGSEQPTNLDIHVTDDMVNSVAPGDRTRITGVLRLYPPKQKKTTYERYLEAVHLEETAKEFEDVEISKEEEEEIKKLAKGKKVYDKLIGSIAPAIYGHETVKEAIVLQLFGGVKKALPGNTNIRGNIHILLVGDPGVAKSQLLMAVNKIAPKSIYVGGKTTSGVGLTASAEKDEFGEGGWTLKAGALVLASGGLGCIDEFDKMDGEDRSAMHEAMEQEMVSVAKAGIVTRFKTETSILAAANPKQSRFDPHENYMQQINLPPTLISRFDLFFMIRDVLDRAKDEKITTHILQSHHVGQMLSQQAFSGKKAKIKDVEDFEKNITPAIEGELLKKYISYTRQRVFPALSSEAIKDLSDFYLYLRDQGRGEGKYSATHRQLEALVRLSEGSARVRLSNAIEKQDTERAIRIFKTSLEELVTDVESGKIDIGLITTGQTHTQLTRIKKVMGIIRDLAVDLDMVPVEQVIENAKAEGLEREAVKDIIKKMKREGDVYEPKNGFIKPADKS